MTRNKTLLFHVVLSSILFFYQTGFGARTFNIKDYGAVGDGVAMETGAIPKRRLTPVMLPTGAQFVCLPEIL